METKNIHEFDDLMADMNIHIDELGCVMLPMEPINIFSEGREDLLDVEDLYISENPSKPWVNGDVSNNAHITLLYGLLYPAHRQPRNIERVLDGWEKPEFLVIEEFDVFPSPDKSEPDYAAIVAKVDDDSLEEAHARLSYLPHVNTFPKYKPHMTLCYVRLESANRWVNILERSGLQHIYVLDGPLNLGGDSYNG